VKEGVGVREVLRGDADAIQPLYDMYIPPQIEGGLYSARFGSLISTEQLVQSSLVV
jgi:hypothetical protein